MKKDIDNFLKELNDLSKKYEFFIGGCGCCGSPYITKTGGDYIPVFENLSFDKKTGEYTMSRIQNLEGENNG